MNEQAPDQNLNPNPAEIIPPNPDNELPAGQPAPVTPPAAPAPPATPAPSDQATEKKLEDMLAEAEKKAGGVPSTGTPAKRKRRRWWIFWLVLIIILATLAGGGWYFWINFLAFPKTLTPISENISLLYRAAAFPTGLAHIKDNQLQPELHNLPQLLEGDVYHAYLTRTKYRIEDQGRISEYNFPLRHDAYLLGSFILDEEGALLDAKSQKRISSLFVEPSLLERPVSGSGGIEISLKIASSPLQKTGQVREAFYQLKGVTLLSGVFNQNWQAELEFPLVSQLEQISGIVERDSNQLRFRLSNTLPLLEAENLGFRFGLWLAKFQGPNVVKEKQIGILDGKRSNFTFTVGIPSDLQDFDRVVISLEPINDSDPSSYDLKPFEAQIE